MHGVHLIPAFVGLGAPHWRTDVRSSITGLTLDTGPAHIIRAALEAVARETRSFTPAPAVADRAASLRHWRRALQQALATGMEVRM